MGSATVASNGWWWWWCEHCSFISTIMMTAALLFGSGAYGYGGKFHQEFHPTFGDNRVQVLDDGQLLSLTLDRTSGSGFQSEDEYLFGRIDMQLKLVPGNSAGTVTAYYLSSQGASHDEIDFEFLGNVSGEPYTLHTNVFTQGKGNREQQFHLWFDPTINFHTYSVVWNPRLIIFLVDKMPIRVFRNHEAIGVPFPKKQPMRIYSSLWNADDWATQGGLIKTDWTKAPFTAYYRGFTADACVVSRTRTRTRNNINGAPASSSCGSQSAPFTAGAWQTLVDLDANSRRMLRWVQRYHMIYNYCSDFKRFPQGVPAECHRGPF